MGVEPEGYVLWDEDRGQYRCPFCDGRLLRVGDFAECLECEENFKRADTEGQQTHMDEWEEAS